MAAEDSTGIRDSPLSHLFPFFLLVSLFLFPLV